jgi:hypothetical protein
MIHRHPVQVFCAINMRGDRDRNTKPMRPSIGSRDPTPALGELVVVLACVAVILVLAAYISILRRYH